MADLLSHLLDMIDRHAVMAGRIRVALGLSGGPDSMALGFCLSNLARQKHPDIHIHAITIDHGLREESAAEAKRVGDWIKDWPNTLHHVIRWNNEKRESRILESARNARYALMHGFMIDHDIESLFIAHHRDDQAETFLFRLAKGSGLDGLCGMREIQSLDGDGRRIIRPFLGVDKGDLVGLCEEHGIPFMWDPTNNKQDYARPRLRAARDVLEQEGLTSKRLAVTANRLARAQEALMFYAHKIYDLSIVEFADHKHVFTAKEILEAPEDIMIRVLQKAMEQIGPARSYSASLEKLEQIVKEMRQGKMKRATLGGCLFTYDPKHGLITVESEHP